VWLAEAEGGVEKIGVTAREQSGRKKVATNLCSRGGIGEAFTGESRVHDKVFFVMREFAQPGRGERH